MQKFILGQREFWSKEEILGIVEKSALYDLGEESTESAEPILIFSTSKQQTWLIVTAARLYCVLDDIRRPQPDLQWVLQRDELVSGGKLTARVHTKDKSDRTGLLDVGPRQNWLYSKALFLERPLEERLTSSLREKMLSTEEGQAANG